MSVTLQADSDDGGGPGIEKLLRSKAVQEILRREEIMSGKRAVGRDGRAYLRHPVKREDGFRYMRMMFAREMYAEGMSKRQIAKECGVSAMTIVRDLRDIQRAPKKKAPPKVIAL